MEIQASRLRARVGPTGEPILLLDQDRARWDQLLIHRGLAALERAVSPDGTYGPYGLQAAIAACHARARTAAETDWARISALYEALAALTPSPVVELNRAVARGMAFGPAAGLEVVDTLTSEPSLKAYHLLPRGSEETSSSSWAGSTRRHAPSSSMRRRLRRTRVSARCSSRAPGRARPARGRIPCEASHRAASRHRNVGLFLARASMARSRVRGLGPGAG